MKRRNDIERGQTLMPHHTTTHLMRQPAARVALALTLALALAAIAPGTRADIVDIAWDADARFERSMSVAPGKFAELCGKLPAGLKVGWRFQASAPLDFNLHYHVGKEVVFPSKLAAVATAKDTLATKIDQDYCWMWSNKSTVPVTVSVSLQR